MSTISLWVVVAFAFANPTGKVTPGDYSISSNLPAPSSDSNSDSLILVDNGIKYHFENMAIDGKYIPASYNQPVYKSKEECLTALSMKSTRYSASGSLTLGCQEQKIDVPDVKASGYTAPVLFTTKQDNILNSTTIPSVGMWVDGRFSGETNLKTSSDSDNNSYGARLNKDASVVIPAGESFEPYGVSILPGDTLKISCGNSQDTLYATARGVFTCIRE